MNGVLRKTLHLYSGLAGRNDANMEKIYNRQVYFPDTIKELLQPVADRCNAEVRCFTDHAWKKVFERGKNRSVEIMSVIDNLRVIANQIFEVKYDSKSNSITSFSIRSELDAYKDIILVLRPDNYVITFYLNDRIDTHKSLDKSKYYREKETKMEITASLQITTVNNDNFSDSLALKLITKKKAYVIFESDVELDMIDSKEEFLREWEAVLNEAELIKMSIPLTISVNPDVYDYAEEIKKGLAHEIRAYV